ncbi:MAG: ribosomal protein S18-alanine N-acetyltransferase [Dehalococcoidales bacterium]|nr:MAG: ribosomal protein S18-alanine N-acetyltransferase [Dehalococcoidales bacterium]
MAYYIRPMYRQDIDDVTEIDHEAFPTQWPPADYQYEIRNKLARYIVVCDDEQVVSQPQEENLEESKAAGWFTRFWRWLNNNRTPGNKTLPGIRHYVIGFTGFWTIAEEAHIIIIAVRETYRRMGIGELLLISLVELAMKQKAQVITLEVRVSNTVAQNLYLKYGFNGVGTRKGYYIDRVGNSESREDGLIMTTQDINSTEYQERFRELKQAHTEKCGALPKQQV